MTQNEIDKVAQAVHDKLMNGPIREIRDDIRILKADMKQVKGSVEHLSDAWDQFQGAT